MNEIERGWEALRKRCCADPEGAKRCVMVSREDFAAAIAAMRGEPVGWQPIETLPMHQEALVCVTFNLGAPEDGYETQMWTDWWDDRDGWFRYPRLIEIALPPTHWMPLPTPPDSGKD